MKEFGPFLFLRFPLSGGWAFYVGPVGIHWMPDGDPKFWISR